MVSITIIFGCIILGLIVIVAVLLMRNRPQQSDNTATELLKADLTELNRSVMQLQQNLGDKLERNSTAVQTSVQRQLGESAKIVADVTRRLTKLDETNRRVVDVADELKTLQNVLQNPKQRGVFGEYYLQTVLDNILAPNQFALQHKFKDGEIVDAVIFLDKGQILPVDSKFSLENYNRMINAETKDEKAQWMHRVRNDLKGRIDETSKYIRPDEHTMDFAFMFIPSEALYYELLINNVGTEGSSRDLIEYAFRDKKVIIVSPTSFMAYLETVLQGLRSLKIEEQTKEIQARIGKLGVHISRFEVYMQKLGGALGTTVNHFNAAHKELGKVDKDIIKIADTDAGVKPVVLDKPNTDD